MAVDSQIQIRLIQFLSWLFGGACERVLLLSHHSTFIICAFMMKLCKFIRHHISLCNALFGKTIRTDCVFARLLNSIQCSTCRHSYHSSFALTHFMCCQTLQRDIEWQSSLVLCEPQICDQNMKSQNVCVRFSEYVKM